MDEDQTAHSDQIQLNIDIHQAKIHNLIADIEKLTNEKASKDELYDQKRRIDKFSEIEHMSYIINTLMPTINSCYEKVTFFTE